MHSYHIHLIAKEAHRTGILSLLFLLLLLPELRQLPPLCDSIATSIRALSAADALDKDENASNVERSKGACRGKES